MARSFSHPGTHYHFVRKHTRTVNGRAAARPTGMVQCCECGQEHLSIDEIPHENDCTQRFVKSRWWVESMKND